MVTRRYGLVMVLLAAALLLTTPVAAEFCWGKICSASPFRDSGLCAICCGGHGTCIGFNNCKCDAGWTGQECSLADFCGTTSCSSGCSGNGICGNGSVPYNMLGTCSTTDGTKQWSCTPFPSGNNSIFANCTLTKGTPDTGTCTLNGKTGVMTIRNTAGTYLWFPDSRFDTKVDPILTDDKGTGPLSSCLCKPGYTGSCCQYLATSLSATSLDFGAQPASSTSPSRTVTFANPTTTDSITVTGIALSGSNPGDFTFGGTCTAGGTVAVGNSCTVTVAFTPAATGSRSATLTLNATSPSGSGTTLTTALGGTGTTSVSRILVDPVTPATVFAGLDGAGIFRSTYSGGLWSAMTLAPATTRIKDLVIRSGDSTKLYAATYGGGVYKSTDSGTSWSACTNTGLTDLNVLSLAMSPAGTLYAGTGDGIFTSTDNCASWTSVSAGLPP